LRKVHAQIAKWTRDRKAVPKIVAALNPCADLAIVGEAIGPKTVRLSGVNYFSPAGRLGKTGKYLDEMLRPLGFTLYPAFKVRLASGKSVQGVPSGQRETAYCTDLCPEFPGRVFTWKGKESKISIKRPSQKRIRDALKHKFLEKELDVVRPKVILLLGSRAYTTFYAHFLRKSNLAALSVAVKDLGSHVARYKAAAVIPFLHPSPASPAFQRWFGAFKNAPAKSEFARCVRRYLKK
jgi:uracil-DNA glycosylase